MFDSPHGMTSDVPFASSIPYYNYHSQTEEAQMTPQNTPRTYVQQTLEAPYVGNCMQNYIHPSTPMQQEYQYTKKFTFYMEVR
jgi:hypothetical protein